MSLATKIDDIAGALGSADTSAQTDWLKAGARIITDIMPVEKVELYASEVTDTGSGIDITGRRMLYDRTHKSGRPAPLFSAAMKAQFADTGSIYYATEKSPISYVELTKLYIKPSGGTGVGMTYPNPSYSDNSITGFPPEYEYGVILYAAIQQKIRQIADKLVSLEGITLDTVTAPSAPSAPAITYSDASAALVDAVTLGALGTAPTYTKPTVSLTAAPTITDLDLSGISAPSVPDAPSITYSDAAAVATAVTTVSALGTAPAYTKPTISLTSAPTINDLTIKAVPPAQLTAPSFTYTDVDDVAIDSTSIGTVPNAPVYTPPTFGGAYTNTDTALSNTDIELANAHLNKVQAQLNEYQTKIGDSVNTFNSNRDKFNADVQKLLEQARLTQEKLFEEARLTTDVQKQNKIQALQKQIQEYQAKLAKYASEVNVYSILVTSEVNEYRANLEKEIELWTTKRANELQQYSLDIQNELNKFNKEVVEYQTDFNHKVEQARITLQEALEDAREANNIALQNEIQTLQALISDYELELRRYLGQVDAYAQQINSSVQQFRANLDKELGIWNTKRTSELQQYSLDIQNELNEFNKELVVYQTEFNHKVEQSRLDIQKALEDARATNDIALQNKIQGLQALIADYQGDLGKYNAELNEYGIAVGQAVSKFQAQIGQITQGHNMLIQSLEAIKKEYNDFIASI